MCSEFELARSLPAEAGSHTFIDSQARSAHRVQLREAAGHVVTRRRARGDVEPVPAVDGGGKAASATRPLLGAERVAKFVLGYARKIHYSETDFRLVTINGTPGLLLRHPIAGTGTYSFDIVDGRIRAIYIVRNPDKLRGFLEHVH